MKSRDDARKNRDPVTGAPGSHPVGTGVGAIAGGVAAGAAAGTVAGPVGTAIGAAVGAIAGGLAGKGIAEMIDPTAEDAYWRDAYLGESYYRTGWTYDDYAPAYRLGYEGRGRYGSTFDAAEAEMARDWERTKGTSRLAWNDAKQATRAAWDRIERALPGDFDRDGK